MTDLAEKLSQLPRLAQDGHSFSSAARIIGMSRTFVARRAAQMDLTFMRGMRPWTEEEDAILRAKRAEGKSTEEIAEEIERPRHGVRDRVFALKLPHGGRFWTDARVAHLRHLAEQSKSASQIAAELRTTRNAVIGKCHREGIKLAGEPGWAPDRSPEGIARRAEKRRLDAIKRAATLAKKAEFAKANAAEAARVANAVPVILADYKPVAFLDLDVGMCRYPTFEGEPIGFDSFFCGAPSVEGKSYCAVHCRLCHRTVEEARAERDLARLAKWGAAA